MKKVLFLMLAAVLISCLLLAACKETTPEPAGTPEPAPTSEPTGTPEPAPTSEPAQTPAPTPEEVIELNFSYHAPAMAGLATSLMVPWADDLEAACGGRIDIIHHPSASLLGSSDAYDGVLAGICDLAQVSTEETPGRLPRSGIGMLPVLFPDTVNTAVSYHEFLNKYAVDTELKSVKLMITLPMPPCHYIGNREIKVLEDFKGVKISTAGGVGTQILEAVDGIPVEISTSDAFSSLDTGLIEGIFFSHEGAIAFGFPDVTKYVNECAIYQSVFELLMNQNTYNKLPDDLKKVFDDFSTVEASRKYATMFMATEPEARKLLEDKLARLGNDPIYVMPPEEKARWREALQPVWDTWAEDMEEDGLPGRQMMDDMLSIIEKNAE